MSAKILKFERKFVSVVACCENCCNSWVAHLREGDFEKWKYGEKKSICPHCNKTEVIFMTREKNQ